MTPPAAATAAGRTATPRVPRRVSGPARPRHGAAPRVGTHAAPPPLGLRVVERARVLSDAPLLDRLIHGRGWIGLVAVALLGIVFMQVSLLKLNAGIGADVKTAQALERTNSQLRAQVSKLQSGGRIQELASGLGLVMPSADGFRYVTAGRPGDAERAARAIKPPDPVEQLPPPVTGPTAAGEMGQTLAPPAGQDGAPPVTQATAPPGQQAAVPPATQPGQP